VTREEAVLGDKWILQSVIAYKKAREKKKIETLCRRPANISSASTDRTSQIRGKTGTVKTEENWLKKRNTFTQFPRPKKDCSIIHSFWRGQESGKEGKNLNGCGSECRGSGRERVSIGK